MKSKWMFLAAVLGSVLIAASAEAQTRYSQPPYRAGVSRSVYYSRSNAMMMGEEHGCASCGDMGCGGHGGCDYCHGHGCGRCCHFGVLGWVARGVGCLADGVGATLDCLFPCGAGCCETACCVRRPVLRHRAWCDGCGDAGCSDCAGGHSLHDSRIEELNATPDAGPTPTPAPDTTAPKDARKYRTVPSTRPTTTRSRSTSAPRVPTRAVPSHAVPASFEEEEEVEQPVKAARPTPARTKQATRLVPVAEAVEYEVAQPTRYPTNPLRSR